MLFADNAGPDLGMRCPVTESMDTVVYVDKQKMLRSDCMDAHTDLDLRYPQMAKGPFSCVVHYIKQSKEAQCICRIVCIRLVCSSSIYPVSILYKSIVGRYRPVRVANGPITTRYRFIKNGSWVPLLELQFLKV